MILVCRGRCNLIIVHILSLVGLDGQSIKSALFFFRSSCMLLFHAKTMDAGSLWCPIFYSTRLASDEPNTPAVCTCFLCESKYMFHATSPITPCLNSYVIVRHRKASHVCRPPRSLSALFKKRSTTGVVFSTSDFPGQSFLFQLVVPGVNGI